MYGRNVIARPLAFLALFIVCGLQQAQARSTFLLTTSVTGAVSRSQGLDDPQYVLSFIPVQRLLLTAAGRALAKSEVDTALARTPVSAAVLLRLGLLREEKNGYRLNYLLLTINDQRTMYRVAARYGRSLADAFREHKADFDAILRRYPNASLRQQLAFDLIAGAALNWGGLDLTTELGYRIKPPRHANGDTFFVHSTENGARLNFSGLYLDSETVPGAKMSFSTFGDGASLPRLRGLPDVFDGVDAATSDWRSVPTIYAALRSEYLTYILLAADDAGAVIDAIANGTNTDAGLAQALTIPVARQKAALQLLVSIGYLREAGQRYSLGVPVLVAADKPLADAVLGLSRTIMTQWLGRNYEPMRNELTQLSPMRNGVPFSLAFSEVWHYEFGFATKYLAESGFYANPRARGTLYPGYVPLVWASSVLTAPGNQ